MEDFYPFTSEDIPEFQLLVQESLIYKDKWEPCAISFLLSLVSDLLGNVERSRALKNAFMEECRGSGVKASHGFWNVVEAYLEENNGTGNLLRLLEATKSKDAFVLRDLENFFLRYSLPASEGNENANVYSLSREFLHEGKEVIAGNSVSAWNANSVEQILQTSVILEEIFKKLRPVDQNLFRLVSPTWMEETFSFWRRNARILIHVSTEKGRDDFGISLPEYMDLWKKNKKIPEEEANGRGKEMQRLQDLPFHSYRVSYGSAYPFSCGQTENDFWRSCGQFIGDLKITCDVAKTNICINLLQDCQNLKRLEIDCYHWIKEDSSGSEEKKETSSKAAKSMKIAKNLHTLTVGHVDEGALRSLLFICPNLKTLDLVTDEENTIGALLSPTLNGEIIKLKKLVISTDDVDDFLSFRRYVEILAKKKFNSLEHLNLTTEVTNARSPPYNLYAALANASNNLKTLKLDISLSDYEDEVDHVDFMDLSPFKFPNLTKLKLSIDSDEVDDFHMKFDFGTLKGMPMLEKLKISVWKLRQEVLRKPGTQDWVFEGDRNRYLPTGVIVDYRYSVEDPILCSKLKEFTFFGWSLNEEDVRLLSSWFPNLTLLKAKLNLEALPILGENWQRLEKLVIHTDKLISLRKLRPLKEKKKNLRIFQEISMYPLIKYGLLELKEHNGWLFFSY